MRNGRILFGVLLGLVLIAVVAGASWYAYNVGLAQGVMSGATFVAPPVDGSVQPVTPSTVPFHFYRGFGWGHPFGFGFGLFGCLVPIFFFLLVFALFRLLFRPHWGGGWGRGGWKGYDGEIPPQVQEWHRKMHDQETSVPPPSSQPG